MQVKITKTIDINEIPGETRRMIDKIKNRIVYGLPDVALQVIRANASTQAEEYFQAIEFIDLLRDSLKSIDEDLQEVQNIITGHKSAIMPKEEVEANPPTQEEPETQEEEQVTQEWLDNREAEYEKLMSQIGDIDEVEDEEG
jgi:hypothetical protein